MLRPLNLSIDLFSGGSYNFLSFCFKETHAWFCTDYFCISNGVEICPCRCGIPGIRNNVDVRRSVNGGLVHVCFSVTPGMAVSIREN